MVHITTTTQFSVFSSFVTIITSDSTLSGKFNTGNIVQYEPLSLKHQSLPFIYIQIPSTSTESEVLNDSLTSKEFDIPMYMFNQYTAKDNILGYINAIVRAFEIDTSLGTLGYDLESIEVVSVRTEEKDGQVVLVTEFTIKLSGNVERLIITLPTAEAGTNKNQMAGTSFAYDGTGSTGTGITYAWSWTGRSTATVVTATGLSGTITLSTADIYDGTLTVTDSYGNTATDTNVYTAVAPP